MSTTTSKPHWYVYRTQHSHYVGRGLPFARTYEEWEPVYLERRRRGVVIPPPFDWRLTHWDMGDDEIAMNEAVGGIRFEAPPVEPYVWHDSPPMQCAVCAAALSDEASRARQEVLVHCHQLDNGSWACATCVRALPESPAS